MDAPRKLSDKDCMYAQLALRSLNDFRGSAKQMLEIAQSGPFYRDSLGVTDRVIAHFHGAVQHLHDELAALRASQHPSAPDADPAAG